MGFGTLTARWTATLGKRRFARALVRGIADIGTHQDIGQMDSYVRMFDAHARLPSY